MKDPFLAICEQCNTARKRLSAIAENEDPEELHQYRVSLRRARSLLRWFGKALPEDQHAELKTCLKAAFQPTSSLRDTDVLLIQLTELTKQLPPELGEIAHRFHLELRQQQLHESTSICQQITSHCQALPQTPPVVETDKIQAILRAKWRRQRKRITRLISRLPDADSSGIHGLRIAFKEVRYLLELFSDSPGFAKATSKLKALQNDLGDFNDCCVHARRLSARLDGCSDAHQAALIGAYWQQLTSRAEQIQAHIQHSRKRYFQLMQKLDSIFSAI